MISIWTSHRIGFCFCHCRPLGVAVSVQLSPYDQPYRNGVHPAIAREEHCTIMKNNALQEGNPMIGRRGALHFRHRTTGRNLNFPYISIYQSIKQMTTNWVQCHLGGIFLDRKHRVQPPTQNAMAGRAGKMSMNKRVQLAEK